MRPRRGERRIESRPQRAFHVRAEAQRIARGNEGAGGSEIFVHVDQHQFGEREPHLVAVLREQLELADRFGYIRQSVAGSNT